LENLYEKYKIIADYHTHTVYSHGKGSIEDNVKKAIEKGLKTIAITDHGSKHFIFGVSEKRLLKQKEEIVQIRKKYPDFQLLFGVESNITGIDGGYDITSGFENNFDIILCGFHKPVWADKLSDYTNIFYNSYSWICNTHCLYFTYWWFNFILFRNNWRIYCKNIYGG